MKQFLLWAAVIAVATFAFVLAMGFIPFNVSTDNRELKGTELGQCRITEATVPVGTSGSTLVIATSSSLQWAIVQQQPNATNTVSFSLSGSNAVNGSGFKLVPATTTQGWPTDLSYGYSTDLRTGNGLRAIASNGATTLTVVTCK